MRVILCTSSLGQISEPWKPLAKTCSYGATNPGIQA
jgi:hypothetical protein